MGAKPAVRAGAAAFCVMRSGGAFQAPNARKPHIAGNFLNAVCPRFYYRGRGKRNGGSALFAAFAGQAHFPSAFRRKLFCLFRRAEKNSGCRKTSARRPSPNAWPAAAKKACMIAAKPNFKLSAGNKKRKLPKEKLSPTGISSAHIRGATPPTPPSLPLRDFVACPRRSPFRGRCNTPAAGWELSPQPSLCSRGPSARRRCRRRSPRRPRAGR